MLNNNVVMVSVIAILLLGFFAYDYTSIDGEEPTDSLTKHYENEHWLDYFSI